MALTPGTRLGVYEITAQIGAGGMGQVYRARDTKLNRDVALKTLPVAFANDADRLARFTREAQTLASLNHPNIAHIHGLEESGGVRALVMELVDGQDLSDLIARGPVSLAESLDIARQIADALEAAHEQGIVHRDLKPANIKVRADGTVKVLDFGLAKALDTTAVGAGFSPPGVGPAKAGPYDSPTVTSPAMTQAGIILGTAAYMAPEQARGKVVDRRADIWAFGVVLYEMLTGRRPFKGAELSDVLAAVLKDEPDWRALPADLPRSVHRLLRRCLEKDPRKRLAAIGDARFELDESVVADKEEHDDPGRQQAPQATSRTPERLMWAALVVAVAVLAPLTWQWFARTGSEPAMTMTRFELALPEGSPLIVRPEVSPDGRQIAGVAAGADGIPRIWLRSMDAVAFQMLAGTEGASYPFWSPNSRTLAFFAGDTLKKIPVTGGPAQPLCQAFRPRGGTWGRAGVILFSSRSDAQVTSPEQLQQVAEGGGSPTVLKPLVLQNLGLQRFPQFLPDGRHFLFFGSARTPETDGVYVASLDQPGATRLVAGQFTEARYSDGYLFFVRDYTLMAQPFDPARRVLSGAEPVVVAPSVAGGGNEGAQAFSVSDSGVLLTVPVPESLSNQLQWLDRGGRRISNLGDPANRLGPRISPNGLRVVTVSPTSTGGQATGGSLWLTDAKSGQSQQLTFSDGGYRDAIWSTDATIVFSKATIADGTEHLYRQPANSGASQELLVKDRVHKAPLDVTRDGHLVYSAQPTQSIFDLQILSLADGKSSTYVKNATHARVSPDGRWLAYLGIEAGRLELYVESFPTPGQFKSKITNGGGDWPVWSLKTEELFYQAGGRLMTVPVSTSGATFSFGQATVLFDLPPSPISITDIAEYDVDRDGRFLFNVSVDKRIPAAVITLNWKEGLALARPPQNSSGRNSLR